MPLLRRQVQNAPSLFQGFNPVGRKSYFPFGMACKAWPHVPLDLFFLNNNELFLIA